MKSTLFFGYQPKVLSYETLEVVAASPTSPHTFTGVDIGTATWGRRIIVAAAASGAGSIGNVTAMTVGGVSATQLVERTDNTGATYVRVELWIAHVPNGTTEDIVVTFSGSFSTLNIATWSCTGVLSNAAVATGTSAADPATATLATVAGGFCIGALVGAPSDPTTWSNVTERFDNSSFTGADGATTGADISPSANHNFTTVASAVFATF